MGGVFLVVLGALLALANAAPKQLYAITNGTFSKVDPATGKITLFPGAWHNFNTLISVTSDPVNGFYILHGFVIGSLQAVQWFDVRDGKVNKTVYLDNASLSRVAYDPKLGKLIGLNHWGVMEVDQTSGQVQPLYSFEPRFQSIDEMAGATLDTARHVFYFMNGSDFSGLQVWNFMFFVLRFLRSWNSSHF